MKKIPLTKGAFAIVDEIDFDEMSKYRWQLFSHRGKSYAVRGKYKRLGINNYHRDRILMHRQLMGFPVGEVDHINSDGLDNRRSNLRHATRQQNCENVKKPSHNTSGFKGVWWSRHCGKWVAEIRHKKKKFYLGCHADIIAAAKAYNSAAIRLFGEFACLNRI